MLFLKDLPKILAIMIVIGLVIYYMYPDMIKQVFEAYGLIFGPLAILMVIVYAMPRKRRSK